MKSTYGRGQARLSKIMHGDNDDALSESSGISIFDPVLCEAVYRWFCPPGGEIIDPFAGGSVRGIVASWLGYKYVGIDLSEEQILSNNNQAQKIISGTKLSDGIITESSSITPIEKRGFHWYKRDDYFSYNKVCGGKVRTCLSLSKGAVGLVTAGSRSSPQVNIVAHVAQGLGIPCRVHVPSGNITPELELAKISGAELIQETPGHNSVIIARAKKDADNSGYTYIPFGMECAEAINQTENQVVSFPDGIKRIVMPVGSGMSLAGVLNGMKKSGINIPVFGIVVGADPEKRLDMYAPDNWRKLVTLIKSKTEYEEPASVYSIDGITLDPYYEAKCIPYLEQGDLLWIVGVRQSALPSAPMRSGDAIMPEWIRGDSEEISNLVHGEFDFLFTCPPYFNLEIYSNEENDLSNCKSYELFISKYRKIINNSVSLLRNNRFACVVVSNIRDRKSGIYYDLVSDTISAFLAAGMAFYNEAILVTMIGSLPIRVSNQFIASRKLGKTHQNVLVFVKGNPVDATKTCGEIDIYFEDELSE